MVKGEKGGGGGGGVGEAVKLVGFSCSEVENSAREWKARNILYWLVERCDYKFNRGNSATIVQSSPFTTDFVQCKAANLNGMASATSNLTLEFFGGKSRTQTKLHHAV